MPSVRVPDFILDDLFEAMGIWRCLESGQLNERLDKSHPAKMWSLPGAESCYTRLVDGKREYARIHYVACPLQGIIGRWPSSLKIDDVTVYRIGHQARSAT